MGIFLQLTDMSNKESALSGAVERVRQGQPSPGIFEVEPDVFNFVSGSPFCYSVPPTLLTLFKSMKRFDTQAETCRGISTLDDFRFIRCWWEVDHGPYPRTDWVTYSKGEENVPFYDGLRSVLKWHQEGAEVKSYVEAKVGSASRTIQSQDKYFREGITWVRRTFRLCLRPLPRGVVFSGGAQAIFVDSNILAYLGLGASSIFDALTKVSVGRTGDAVQFEPGMIAKVPTPRLDVVNDPRAQVLSELVHRAWSLQRVRDSLNENSLAFELPVALRARLSAYDPPTIEAELARIQYEIDGIVLDLYGFSQADREGVQARNGAAIKGEVDRDEATDDDGDDNDIVAPIDETSGLLSWAVGVAFGRFDWRLATGERAPPPEAAPFDPLPAKSPGMLPDGVDPFHRHPGLLVDDPGHPHDLTRLVEGVLVRVEAPVPSDVRRWLQRDFFPFHLRRYSKSRRKAPIYWPLSTASGNYTLWLYYPSLSSQTLYTAVNDFIEPKLKQVGQAVAALRTKGNTRSREENKGLELLQGLELELIDLRDLLLQIAPDYHPNHNDGVLITAGPLWPLIRYKPWQKALKDTWAKLEKGDYDWAHLAIAYWPDRVREKCKSDKSLAIAHDLEHLYTEPEQKTARVRGRKKTDP